ncbi:MAG TPA: MMPL family transporter [Thermoleophilaceae bacterium]
MLKRLFGWRPDVAGGLGRVARTVTGHPIATVAVVVALALVGLALALRLEPSASTDTLVGRDTATFKATEKFRDRFGDDAVIIMVRGDLQRTILTEDLQRLVTLEQCLAGNAPAAARAELPPVCDKLARAKPAQVVYGPGTFINVAVTEIQKGFQTRQAQAAAQGKAAGANAVKLAKRQGLPRAEQERLRKAAEELAINRFTQEALQLGLRYGLALANPAIDNPEFVSQLVFDTSKGPGIPKPRFAFLFPSPNAAMVQFRLRPNLTDAERTNAIALVREAVAEPQFKLQRGGKYVVTGIPVVVAGLTDAVQRSIFILLAAAVLLMAITLLVVFRTRLRTRLLPLGTALAAAAMTYGCMKLAGFDLTMASIAALPVLIGLAVDYAIQLQARYDENRYEEDPDGSIAARAAAARGGPLITGAALATAAGFLVLLLSPVPMIHGFAVTVIAGIVLALVCALTAGLATLSRWSEPKPGVPAPLPRARELGARTWDRIALSRPGRLAGRIGARAAAAAARAARGALGFALDRPRNVLVAGLALAAIGWAADTQTEFVSDVRKLVPQDLPALRDINELERETGVSGEIDVMISGNDLTEPHVISWMTNFQKRVLEQHDWQTGKTCRQEKDPPQLCPALSLTDLFRQTPGTGTDARSLLSAVPPYFSQAVITQDRRTANLAFGIRLQPLDQQEQVVEQIRKTLEGRGGPPPGVQADIVGLPVLAAESNGKLAADWRRALMLLAGLAAVFLVLLAIRRRFAAAAVPLIPIALATGWSSLILFLIGIPLNPMSATLGALVIAISTEFSVLLSARYHSEREEGADPEEALELTYASTGAAVLASGATAIAGFAALIASDVRMLQQFGIVTVVDLTVSLLGVMVVLPAALVWAEERSTVRWSDLRPRRLLREARWAFGDATADMQRPALPRGGIPRPGLPSARALRRGGGRGWRPRVPGLAGRRPRMPGLRLPRRPRPGRRRTRA